MPVVLHGLRCDFVGSFKVGDNIVYNAGVMCKLAEANTDHHRFNKMIVLQAGSILEAALSEIIFRAQHFNREGVPNISENDRLKIQGKKIDTFNNVIDVLKQHGWLDGLGTNIYRKLHNLRRYRNKIHIQYFINIDGVSPDEKIAFSRPLTSSAMDLNLNVLTHLNCEFARPKHIQGSVQPFCVPTGFP